MKRWISLFVLLCLTVCSFAASATSVHSYDAYLSELMEAFDYGEYQDVVDLYEEICEYWPNAWDRGGDVDNYALYARGRLALEKHDYNEAISCFSVLYSFPSEEEQLNSDRLTIYCEAQRFLVYGLNEEAQIKFSQCGNILDSAAMIQMLNRGAELTIFSPAAEVRGGTRVRLTWVDTDEGTETYFITYMPKGVRSGQQTIASVNEYVMLEDLIPSTTYTAYISPVTGDSVSGLRAEMEFTTGNIGTNRSIIARENVLYEYNMEGRHQFNSRLSSDSDAFLDAFSSASTLQYFIQLEVAKVCDKITLPYGPIAAADHGYIYQLALQMNGNAAPVESVRVILRAASADNPNLVYWKDVPVAFEKTGYAFLTFYLDDILDMIYENQGCWPYDTDLIIELIAGENLILNSHYYMP